MCLYLFDGVEMHAIYYFFYKFWLKERYVCQNVENFKKKIIKKLLNILISGACLIFFNRNSISRRK